MYPHEPEPKEMTIESAFSFREKHDSGSASKLLNKVKREETKPHDAFEDELSLESIFSKLAIISFFLFLASIGAVDVKSLTFVSFAGFLMFSFFYGFLRIKRK